MATINDVAKKAGVSIATVSLVLNGKGFISEETRAKVRGAADSLAYRPNLNARALRRSLPLRTDCVGVLLPLVVADMPEDNCHYHTIYGVEKTLQEAGKHLVLGWIRKEGDEYTLPKMLYEKQMDKLIFLSSAEYRRTDELLLKIKSFDIPTVIIGYPGEKYGFSSILLDYRQAAYRACMHLIESGYKSIAAITGPLDYSPAKERFDGYALALVENNLPVASELVYEGDFSEISGYRGMKEIMRGAELPLGIFASNDTMAKGVFRYLSENKIDVPREAGIVGFDNIAGTVNSTRPPLSSVNAHWCKIGEAAAQQAMFLEHKDLARNVMMSCELVTRGSSMLKGPAGADSGQSTPETEKPLGLSVESAELGSI